MKPLSLLVGANRPLSPHLQIYRPQLNSALSILHRITGFISFIGLLIAVFCLNIASLDTALTSSFYSILMPSVAVLFVLVTLFYIVADARYIVWIFGYCYDQQSAKILNLITLVIFLLASALLLIYLL